MTHPDIHIDIHEDDHDERKERRRLDAIVERILRNERENAEQFRRIHHALKKIIEALHKLTDVPVVKSLEVKAGTPV
jgi:hypothetical protein